MGILKAEAAVPGLIVLLKDECETVIGIAAEALGKIKSEKAVPKLVKLLKSNDMFIRRSANEALGKIKSQKTMVELNKILNEKKFLKMENGSYYTSALNLLGEIQAELGYYRPVKEKPTLLRQEVGSKNINKTAS